jgi:flavodoxin/ferredoxin
MALLPLKKIFSQGKAALVQGTTDASGQKPLKAAIVYYSATGSTAKIAKAIHRGMKSSMDCDLIKVKKADPKKMAKYDVIGIGGPIWYFRDTANLKLFIQKMPDMSGKLCFAFCAHGSEPIGFFSSIWDSLAKKNFTLLGWNDWYGSVFHVLHMPKPYLTDGHPDEIDLQQAESFGHEMADRAQRYTAGDKNILPEIPQGTDVDALWIRHDLPEAQRGPGPKTGSKFGDGLIPKVVAASAATAVTPVIGLAGSTAMPGGGRPGGPGAAGGPGAGGPGAGGPGGAGGGPGGPPGGPPGGFNPMAGPKVYPKIDMAKCVYPRCDACIFGCPVNAIDMSMAAPGKLAASELIIKNACISCGLCERMCVYDAMTYDGHMPKTKHVYDMSKCTYPKCTLCVDKCPMNCIDFSTRPPTVHFDCEGCDVCYCVCPHDAISIPNLAQNHMLLRMTGPNHPFVKAIEKYEAAGRFRRLTPIDKIGFDHPIFMNKNAPRIVLNEDDEATYCDKPCKL